MPSKLHPRRTKIVCTIGPASDTPELLDALIEAGMDVARLNFSHGTHETHAARARAIREAQERADRPVALMARDSHSAWLNSAALARAVECARRQGE